MPIPGEGFSGDCSGEAILMSSLNLFPGEWDVLVGVGELWFLKPPNINCGGCI